MREPSENSLFGTQVKVNPPVVLVGVAAGAVALHKVTVRGARLVGERHVGQKHLGRRVDSASRNHVVCGRRPASDHACNAATTGQRIVNSKRRRGAGGSYL